MEEEKIIVLVAGAVTTIGGAIKAYFDYLSKKAELKGKKEPKEKAIEAQEETTSLDKLLKDLSKDYDVNKIIIVKQSKNSEYATQNEITVTHEIPTGDIAFVVKNVDVDAFKSTIDDLIENEFLAIPRVYEYPNQSFKELLFKYAFVSCYAFTISNDKERLGSLFMLYREETILSKFDVNDIRILMKDISKHL